MVPSIGSIIHTRSFLESFVVPNSSPMTLWAGNVFKINFLKLVSILLSISVTRFLGSLFYKETFPALPKYFLNIGVEALAAELATFK